MIDHVLAGCANLIAPAKKVRDYGAFVTALNVRLGGLAAVPAEADPEVAQ
jgi:hypothetical protein